MSKRTAPALTLLTLALTACGQLAQPGGSSAPTLHSQAAVTANVYIDWGEARGAITNELYGVGLYGGVAPSVATQPTYKTNLSYFKPGLVRFHYNDLINDSATDPRGWVDVANRRWDEARIKTVMDAIDSLNSGAYGYYKPAKLVNIPRWPAWMKTYTYTYGGHSETLLDPSEFDNYAAFCAGLATILKNQGRNVKYYTPTNELDSRYYVPYVSGGDKLDELITIHNKVAAAIRAADPNAKIGGLEFARGDLTDGVRRFIRGTKGYLDVVMYHFYANDDVNAPDADVYNRTQDAARHGQDIVNIVRQEGLSLPVMDTEFNINYAGHQDYKMTLSQGAVFDALVFIGAANTGQVGTAAWNDRDGYYGKLNNDDGVNSIRVGAHNLQIFNNFMTGQRVTSTSDNGAVVTLATTSAGRKSVALVNRSGAAQTVKVNFSSPWSTAATWNRYVVAPDPKYYYTGTLGAADLQNGNLTVEPNSVTVLTVADSAAVTSTSRELSRTGWTASASGSGAGEGPANALDGSVTTRWSTGAPQANGQWFQVDFGSAKTFDRVILDANNSLTDFPRRYEVYASNDPANLGTPLVTGPGIAVNGSAYGTGGGFAGAPTIITFAPKTARYLRIVQKGCCTPGSNWWAINDLRVYSH